MKRITSPFILAVHPYLKFLFLPIQSYSILIFMEETGVIMYLVYQSIILNQNLM